MPTHANIDRPEQTIVKKQYSIFQIVNGRKLIQVDPYAKYDTYGDATTWMEFWIEKHPDCYFVILEVFTGVK